MTHFCRRLVSRPPRQSCYSDDMAGNKPVGALVWVGVTHHAN